ncbi:hypothetical protein GGF32_006873 [Allomyces javanicus]|nr:hypothetical protein GGF32_006873 [Allomyces javanicus]
MLSDSKDLTDTPHDGGTTSRRRTSSAAAHPGTPTHDPTSAAITTSRKRHRSTTADHERTADAGGDRTDHHSVLVKRHRPTGTVDPALLTRGGAGDPHAPGLGTPQRLDPTTEPATPGAPPSAAAAVPLPSPDAPTPVLVAELESWTARVRNEPNPFIAVISARLCAGSIAEYILQREQVAPQPTRPASPAHPVLTSTAAAAAQLATVADRSTDLARAHAAMVQLLDSMRARIRSDPAFETLCNDAVDLAHIHVSRMLDAAGRARDSVANPSAAMVGIDDAARAAHDFLVAMGADEAAAAATAPHRASAPLDRLATQVDRLRWFHGAVVGCEDVADAAAGVARVIEVLDALGRDLD